MAANNPGVIERGCVYTLARFLEITGMGRKGLRDARESGLRVVIHGKVGYVSGDDFNDWIRAPGRKTQRWSNRLEREEQRKMDEAARRHGLID
jgi:hypothetical protein